MNGRIRYWIAQPPDNEAYRLLLDFCANRCAEYSVVINKRALPSQEAFEFLEQAKPFLLSEKQQPSWPGGGTLEPVATATVAYIRVCVESISLLKKASDDLYDWVHPFLPEDLAFYRADGSVMLAVIGHEQAAFLELDQRERTDVTAVIPGLALSTLSPI